jgi:hypothetical protein
LLLLRASLLAGLILGSGFGDAEREVDPSHANDKSVQPLITRGGILLSSHVHDFSLRGVQDCRSHYFAIGNLACLQPPDNWVQWPNEFRMCFDRVSICLPLLTAKVTRTGSKRLPSAEAMHLHEPAAAAASVALEAAAQIG